MTEMMQMDDTIRQNDEMNEIPDVSDTAPDEVDTAAAGSGAAAEPDDTAAADAADTPDGVDESLRDEMEQLAETFQKTLDEQTELSDSGEEAADHEGEGEDDAESASLTICPLCGENPVDTDGENEYEYCALCREKLKKTKYSPLTLLVPIVIVLAMIFAAFVLGGVSKQLPTAAKALVAEKTHRLSTAAEYYVDCLDFLRTDKYGEAFYKSSHRKLTEKIALLSWYRGDLTQAQSLIDELKDSGGIKNGKLRRAAAYVDALQDGWDSVTSGLQAYLGSYTPDYDGAILLLKEQRDQYSSEEWSEEPASGDEGSDRVIDIKTRADYMTAAIDYYLYRLLSQTGDEDEALGYLEETAVLAPEARFLYASDLCFYYLRTDTADETLRTQNIDKALSIAEDCVKLNAEDAESGAMLASIYRAKGDLAKALTVAEKTVSLCPDSHEATRQQAILLLLGGSRDEAMDLLADNFADTSALTRFDVETYAACAYMVGDDEAVEKAKTLYENYGLSFGQKLNDLLDGKTTVEDIFTKGVCDIL